MSDRHKIAGVAAGGLALIVAIVALGSAAGGSDKEPAPPVALVQTVDCSPSMNNVLAGLGETIEKVTIDGARPGSLLLAGSFVGDPSRRGKPWTIDHRYDLEEKLKETGDNEPKAIERIGVDGRKNAEKMRGLVSCKEPNATPDAPGEGSGGASPLLSVLEQAAVELDTAHLEDDVERRVVMWTDGVIVGDGLDARRGIADTDIAAKVQEFAPLMQGLRGARVWIIGAGSGTDVDETALRATRRLFDRLLDEAGARLESFGASGASYPTGS